MAKQFYAITKGRRTGIFEEPWSVVQKDVVGFSGARYKGFETLAEAQDWFESNTTPDIPLGGLVAYVDGSNKADGSAASWGVLIADEDDVGSIIKIQYASFGNAEYSHLAKDLTDIESAVAQRNIFGELCAAVEAVKNANANLGISSDNPMTIYHDYEGVALFASGAWKTRSELTKAYSNYMSNYVKSGIIRFIHVKGHTNVIGNEIADTLAGLILQDNKYRHLIDLAEHMITAKSSN